jgi:hypothetical protein
MAVTKVADLDSIIQTITAATQLTSRNEVVMRQLVRVLEMPEHKGNPIDRPKLGKLIAHDLTEGVDIAAPQSLVDTDVSINPLEVGLQTILTDRNLSRSPAGFLQMVKEEHRRAYAEKLDEDLLALFSGFSNGHSGANSAVTVGHFGGGHAFIKGNTEPGPDPIYAVMHPYHAWDVIGGLIPLSSGNVSAAAGSGISEHVLATASIGKIFNTMVFEDGNISVDSSDDSYSAVFSKEAIMLIVVDEGSMRSERNESLRAWELNFVGEYGLGEWVDSYGYYVLGDATAPS